MLKLVFTNNLSKGKSMNNEQVSRALVGVLIETYNQGYDIEDLVEFDVGGLEGREDYAPDTEEEKAKEIESLRSALSEAIKLAY